MEMDLPKILGRERLLSWPVLHVVRCEGIVDDVDDRLDPKGWYW